MKRNYKLTILLDPFVGTTDLTKNAQTVNDLLFFFFFFLIENLYLGGFGPLNPSFT